MRNYEKLDIKQGTLVWMYKFSSTVVQIVGQKDMERAFSEEGELMCSQRQGVTEGRGII